MTTTPRNTADSLPTISYTKELLWTTYSPVMANSVSRTVKNTAVTSSTTNSTVMANITHKIIS